MTQPEIFLCSKCYCIYYSIHISFVHSLLIYLSCYFAHVQMESLYIIQKTAKTTKKSSNIHQGCSVDFVRYYIVWKRIAKDNLSHNALFRIIEVILFYYSCFIRGSLFLICIAAPPSGLLYLQQIYMPRMLQCLP